MEINRCAYFFVKNIRTLFIDSLTLQMEWSQPETQGTYVTPRGGHAGTLFEENWYIVGGGDNKSGNYF